MRRCILNSSCSSIRFGGTDVLIEDCEDGGKPRFGFRGSLSAEESAKGAFTSSSVRRRTLNAFLYYCDGRFGKLPYEPGNIVIRNCDFEAAYDLFKMTFGEHIWCCGEALRSITFENCRLKNLKLPIGILGDKEHPIEFRLKNVELAANEPETQVIIDAENYSLIELSNVKLSGYSEPKLVIRSDGEIKVDNRDAFEVVREASGGSEIKGN